jgi:hypothetical protein
MSLALSLLAFACSSSSTNDTTCGVCENSDDDIAMVEKDATTNDSGDASCVYPDDAGNDPLCPSTYSFSFNGTACPKVGLTCGYPGAGDQGANGCFETAGLICNAADAGVGSFDAAIFDDAGDSGIGYWTAVQ